MVTIGLKLPCLEKNLSLKECVFPSLMVDGVMASWNPLLSLMVGGTQEETSILDGHLWTLMLLKVARFLS